MFVSYTLKSLNKSDSFLSKGLWPTGGLVQPSAGKTAVDAELAANVRDAVPPHVDVVVLEIDEDFSIADASNSNSLLILN